MMALTQLSQTILEQMPHAVYVRDAGMNLIYMNPAAERLTGWTVEDLCSEHGQSMDLIQGEGELCQGVRSGSGMNGIGLSPVATEGTLKTRFGHRVQIRISLSSLSRDSDPGWVLCVIESVSRSIGETDKDGAFFDRSAMESRALPEEGRKGAALIGETLDGGSLKDALRQSEERFRLIASAANDSLWDWDLETDTLWWSEVETGAFGHGPALLPSIPSWAEFIHPDDRERVVNSMHNSLSGNRLVWVDTYRFRKGDGTYIDIRDRGRIIRNQDGQAVRMVGAMTDITQEKRSESALQFFRHIISQVDDPIYWLSPEEGFRFVYVNEAACRHYGYPEEELLRLSIPDWDPNYSLEACEAFWQDLMAQKSKVFETLHRRRNGELVPVEITANYVAYEGKEYIAGTIKNITERKRAELERAQRERLVTLMLNTGPGCIKRIAADGTLLHMNPAGLTFIEAERKMMDGGGRYLSWWPRNIAPRMRRCIRRCCRVSNEPSNMKSSV
jgi:PAS domain S-box-containing protein